MFRGPLLHLGAGLFARQLALEHLGANGLALGAELLGEGLLLRRRVGAEPGAVAGGEAGTHAGAVTGGKARTGTGMDAGACTSTAAENENSTDASGSRIASTIAVAADASTLTATIAANGKRSSEASHGVRGSVATRASSTRAPIRSACRAMSLTSG